jgi:YVTN family beta-propeller protein
MHDRRRLSRALVVLAAAVGLAACGTQDDPVAVGDGAVPVAEQTTPAETSAPAAPAPEPEPPVLEPGPLPDRGELSDVPSEDRRFTKVDELTGELTPKSVVASGTGLVVAQNMIYTHTVSAFNSNGLLLETIDDAIVPSDFGYEEWTEEVDGGPVEAAFSKDGSQLWVSNYSMYGPGFGNPGDDDCTPQTGVDTSFLYRIDTEGLDIVEAVEVGAVPKYLEVTPDGAHVLVTNWCTWDLSVVATNGGEATEVARVPIGRYPRGIAISPDSTTAYVAVMGGSEIAVVDIAAAAAGAGEDSLTWFEDIGRGPRHLNLTPDGSTLFATLNKDGEVVKIDAATGEVLGSVATGSQPRSAALSADGTALFVVNYESDTVSRVRTSDLEVLESVPVDHHPIGITYDALTQRIWVASYGGTIAVFDDDPQ